MCDGWSGPTRLSIINFLVYCDDRTIFHKSINASDQVKDANYIFKLMDAVVEEIGEENVVQVVTDSAPNYRRARLNLMLKRHHLYWTPCAAHCIDLIFKDISELPKVKDVVANAKLITNFIYNHNWVLALMRKYTGGDLVRPAATRFATNYIVFESLMKRKQGLLLMVMSIEWIISPYMNNTVGKTVNNLLTSGPFWTKVDRLEEQLKPLFILLRIFDGDKDQTMGKLVAGMELVRYTLKSKNHPGTNLILDIINNRWEGMCVQDIHMAAHYLNPNIQYNDPNIGHDTSYVDAVQRVVSRLEPNVEKAIAAMDDLKIFRDGAQGFADRLAVAARQGPRPTDWWLNYGKSAPNLRGIAIRILSQTSSSSGCERNWSTFGAIHIKTRNRLSHEKLQKLVYVHYNLRLKKKFLQLDHREEPDVDPINLNYMLDVEDPVREWIEDVDRVLVMDEMATDQQTTEPDRVINDVIEELNADDDDETQAPLQTQAQDPSDSDGDGNGSDIGGNVAGGGVGGQSYAPIQFTCEQGNGHATQDSDHGAPKSSRSSWGRKGKRSQNPEDSEVLMSGIGSLSISSDPHTTAVTSSTHYGPPSTQHGSSGLGCSSFGSSGRTQTDVVWVPPRLSTPEEYARFYYEWHSHYYQYYEWGGYCSYVKDLYNIILVSPLPDIEHSEFEPARHSTWL